MIFFSSSSATRKLALHTFQQPSTNTATSQPWSMDRTDSKSNEKGVGLAGKSNTVVEKKPKPPLVR